MSSTTANRADLNCLIRMNSLRKALWQTLPAFVGAHARSLSMGFGVLLVALWTSLRHISNGINFDITGQIYLADQWLRGLADGAQLGATNYLLKMPLYMVVNGMEFLSPRQRLLLLLLLLNIATFIGLFVVIEKLIKFYDVRDKSWFYISMVWLASISGRVFWLDYPNSRNLEVLGGIAFLYVLVLCLREFTLRSAAVVAVLGGVVFFADPLQAYMIGLPVCVYFVVRYLAGRSANSLRQMVWAGGLTAAAFAGSKIIGLLTVALLPVSYLGRPGGAGLPGAAEILHSAGGSIISTLQIFDAYFWVEPPGPNYLRRLGNFVILLLVIAVAVQVLRQQSKVPGPWKFMIPVVFILNLVVYILSGLSDEFAAERYLILLPVLAVIGVSIWAPALSAASKSWLQPVWLVVLAAGVLLVAGALVQHYPQRYTNDAYAEATAGFLQDKGYTLAVALRHIALPSDYLSDFESSVLPVLCAEDKRLIGTNLFFDKAAFDELEDYDGEVPLILLPPQTNDDGPVCSRVDIVRQFGQPLRENPVPGVGTALVYPAKSLRAL